MEQVLELVFKTAEGDTKVITVTDPRTDITAEEAQAAKENKKAPFTMNGAFSLFTFPSATGS